MSSIPLSPGARFGRLVVLERTHNFISAEDLDFRKAWALTNLRLLPARENWQKSKKILFPFQPSFSWGEVE